MAHYFTNDDLVSEKKEIKITVRGQTYTFITDNGVFSKKGLDFGTRTLLETLPKLSGDILDLGCGWGPIGIVLSSEVLSVDMVDINQRAIELARMNAKLNNKKVNIFVSDVYENITKKYDYIITNPPIRVGKNILYKFLFEAKKYLKENGELWLVIHKDQGAKSMYKKLSEEYVTTIVNKNKGFYIISVKSH